MSVSFDYGTVDLSDIRVEKETDDKGRVRVTSVVIDGEQLNPSHRFWVSQCALFGLSMSIYKYFSHEEVFTRITESSEEHATIRYCIERNGDDDRGTLLAVTNPNKPFVEYENLLEQVENFGGLDINYHDGIVESTHIPRVTNTFDICGDKFDNRFVMSTPIDGYGMPSIYLALLRDVCQNGVVAHASAFKTGIALGKGEDNVIPAVIRALDGFNSDEGYAAIRQRVERATESCLSVREALELYKIITGLMANSVLLDDGRYIPAMAKSIGNYAVFASANGVTAGDESSVLLRTFHKMTGNITEIYGIANMDAFSLKRQSTLPVRCTVYDALNYATEVATHYTNDAAAARKIYDWVGTVLSNDYDLEGSKKKYGDFEDILIKHKFENNLTGSVA